MEQHQPPVSRLPRLLVALAASRPGGWFLVRIAPHIDRLLLRLSRGRFGITTVYPSLILTTIGAKSGQPRTTPLVFLPDGDRIVLIASNGGNPRNPGWYYNLRANPRAEVLLKGRTATYTAREVHGAERAELWQRAVALYPGYAVYQQRAGGREIPVMALTRA